ncbi:MAG: discoidin domain-containing protein [Phycisphaerales bacterium]|nr:MAG: discoidin domain-containing protein [Phycisphaerales bacterium]
MCRKLTCLVSLAFALGLVLSSVAHAEHPRPVGWWKLDGDVLDSSGNGYNGTLNGTPTWVPGRYGEALDLAGSDYVTIDGYKGILRARAFSVTAWIRTTDNGVIVGWGAARGGGDDGRFAQLRTNNDRLRVDHGGGNVAANIVVTDDQWHHVALTVTENAAIEWPDVKLYVDGEEDGDRTTDNDLFDISDDFVVAMGIEQDIDGRQFAGVIDDVRIYDIELTPEQVQEAMAGVGPPEPGAASEPNPAQEQVDVDPDVVLSWTPGKYAPAVNGHTLYLSENLDDVQNGVGGIVQSANSYAPAQRLDFDKTYYWRVDEVNAPPDSSVFEGTIWQFTVESIAYPIAGDTIITTASSSNSAGEGPENTINGSGLDAGDLHSVDSTAMWLSSAVDPNGAWIQYEFDKVHELHQMTIWNHNTSTEPIIGFGIKEATIEYSTDGTNWTPLGANHEFAQGSGLANYAANTTIGFDGAAAKYVKITANSNWGGLVMQFGLSEVRFSSIPLFARRPNPDPGATDIDVNVTLDWRAGREASAHDVYLDTDEQVVIDGNVPVATVTDASYSPAPLDLASTYFWRIDEVNEAETPTTWQGEIWDFTTQEHLAVDDFESYNDILTGEEGSRLVYEIWSDGYADPSKGGSQIGYFEGTSLETDIVFDGEQSVPLFYDNSVAAHSEVTANVADLLTDQDWGQYGIKALTLRFYGDPNNSVNDRMYVKVNGSKVTYGGDPENVARIGWQMWYIDLTSLGLSLSNVTTLSIGFERAGALGGQGVVYLDSIRLYPHDRQVITPVDPGTAGLQAHYEFEGNTNDSSGNARHGTAMGNPTFVAGKIGQATQLRGIDYVVITGYKGILGASAFSISAWIKTALPEQQQIILYGTDAGGQRCEFRIHQTGRIRMGNGAGQVENLAAVSDGGWHHVVVTINENSTNSSSDVRIYVDGQDDTRESTDPDVFNILADWDVTIGYRPTRSDRGFLGELDDVRIYDRALSPEEAAWLAGRTQPFDKPF